MRKVLKDRHEVAHYWANRIQSEGRAGNMFFEDGRIYSYGRHFLIARLLPTGVVVFTLRDYSPSTGQHKSIVRGASSHRTYVYAADPADSCRANMAQARHSIRDALEAAERPRIRQTTRDGHKSRALRIAEHANAYLEAMRQVGEDQGEQPIATDALEGVRAALIAAEEAAARIRLEQEQARQRDLVESLEQWRNHEIVTRTGLSSIPCALRLSKDGEHVQTSWGADIPTAHAMRLWPLVLRVRAAGVAWGPGLQGPFPVGVYTLRTIRGDGSIVVGCHDIAFSELEGIARALGLEVPAL